ncbi:NUDIX domain-containing protein [Microbacterium pseudoresistens]|uniref:8-oxo-dGTP pyrophosphatase MutT (NUDIX family) n=1 Tax=Microbacterium pseudoresistens TaxID=640634 RepID=A0A7Y9ETE1_9MICO|nr:NUDIX domain-containing protein [Microbacterium pseudoresistens]NYD53419.1 8-oxo-dGTP pyrophosphatase MutT (NUDIX family) [Microbacterium pseudoresistens]
MPDIHVSAAVITDAAGRALVVRKRGTERFMQPGGKPEPGETAAQTLARELEEELGLVVAPGALRPLGVFISAAANEPGHRVVATAFAMTAEDADVRVQAELEELRWIRPDETTSLPLAPLSTEHLLPLAWPGGMRG